MKPICIIPARGNSKGVPKKNIRKIMGKPLIAYTIEKSIKSNIFSHVIVSTEDKEIAAISRKFGAKVPFMRPKYLATDNTRADDYLLHAVKKLLDLGFEFDIVVWRDCTVPFIRNKDIKNSIKLLKEKRANLVIGVYHQHLNPYYNIVEYTKTKNLKLCKKLGERPGARQNAPKVFQMNGLHTFDVKKFLFPNRKIRFEISKSIPLEIPIESGIMIDTEFEFQLTKLIIENQHEYFTNN